MTRRRCATVFFDADKGSRSVAWIFHCGIQGSLHRPKKLHRIHFWHFMCFPHVRAGWAGWKMNRSSPSHPPHSMLKSHKFRGVNLTHDINMLNNWSFSICACQIDSTNIASVLCVSSLQIQNCHKDSLHLCVSSFWCLNLASDLCVSSPVKT